MMHRRATTRQGTTGFSARRALSALRFDGLRSPLYVLLFFATPLRAQQGDPKTYFTKPDIAKVVGADTCTKCHGNEVQTWMATPHFLTFDAIHRLPEAKQIADRLGVRSVKRDGECVRCHYTEQLVRDRPRLVAGISCESCHGGARDWLEKHADYGGAGVTKDSETPEHKALRRAESISAGMNNPSNLYLIARQCLDCHTTPNERLVNVGGHRPGSPEFELVAWSQGKLRHNFQRTGGATNEPSSPARLRVMYVVGLMADLEFSLRAVAGATEVATFGQASAARAASAKRRLWEAQRLIDHPMLKSALEAVGSVKLTANNPTELKQAADAISQAAYKFAAEANGEELAVLDPLLPTPEQYKN